MTFLKWLWSKWLPIARAIGNFQGQVILSIFYLLILLPVGIIMRRKISVKAVAVRIAKKPVEILAVCFPTITASLFF